MLKEKNNDEKLTQELKKLSLDDFFSSDED